MRLCGVGADKIPVAFELMFSKLFQNNLQKQQILSPRIAFKALSLALERHEIICMQFF